MDRKANAVYGAAARKAEGDEVRSMGLMKKPAAKKPAAKKPDAVYGSAARKAEGDEVRYMSKLAKGGSVSKRADGIARKGKTKGRMV